MIRVAWLALAVALAPACAAPVADRAAPPPGEPTPSVWVLDHGWHTAIVVRRADVDRALWPEVDEVPTATFVEIAWGDREFYMATAATAWMAVKASLGAGASVLHVVGLDAPIGAHVPQSEIVELRVSRRGFEALTRFVSGEHERDISGRPVRIQRGLHGPSWFYAARGTYSLFNTCNTWVARALRTAGLPVTPFAVITAGGVMRQITTADRPRVAP